LASLVCDALHEGEALKTFSEWSVGTVVDDQWGNSSVTVMVIKLGEGERHKGTAAKLRGRASAHSA